MLVDDFNQLAVGLERDGLHVGLLLPEEEALVLRYAGLVGHLAFEVADVDTGDFVFGETVCNGVFNGVGIVLGLDKVAGLGTVVGETLCLQVAVGVDKGGHVVNTVGGHSPSDVLGVLVLALEVFNKADGHIGLFD